MRFGKSSRESLVKNVICDKNVHDNFFSHMVIELVDNCKFVHFYPRVTFPKPHFQPNIHIVLLAEHISCNLTKIQTKNAKIDKNTKLLLQSIKNPFFPYFSEHIGIFPDFFCCIHASLNHVFEI